MATDAGATDSSLEHELEGMLEIEKFEPPAEFRERANWSDPAIYEEAAADPVAWWTARSKELLDWDVEPTEGLNDSDPPFYKWFEDGRINASAQCLDRHVAAGIGDRVAYHWRGEEGEERDVTYADLHRDVQRFANALKDLGVEKGDVVGIYLPMIPEVAVAMLACARIGAIHNVVFGGFSAESVRERMEFADAKALVTVDGARRKGKTAPIKEQVDEQMGSVGSLKTIVVVRATGIDVPMTEGRDVFYDEVCAAADPECPAEPMEAEHPLFILYTSRLDREAEGDPPHHRRLPHRRGDHAPLRLRPEAGDRRLLVRRRRRLDHRPHLHRLRAARQRGDLGDVGGGARLPAPGRVVGERRALQGDDPLRGADRDPHLHQVGRRHPGQVRPLLAAPAGLGRRADQSEGLALVPQGDRRRTLPDRRHLVADGDRRDHDHAAAGDHGDQAGLGDDAVPGGEGRGRRREGRASRSPRARAS